MHSRTGDPDGSGCPIRRSQDHCSVTSFPGLIAGSRVLHRLSTPRHPPCALVDLITPTRTRLPSRPASAPSDKLRLSAPIAFVDGRLDNLALPNATELSKSRPSFNRRRRPPEQAGARAGGKRVRIGERRGLSTRQATFFEPAIPALAPGVPAAPAAHRIRRDSADVRVGRKNSHVSPSWPD